MMPASPHLQRQPWPARWFPNNEFALIGILAVEVMAFALFAPNFMTAGNFFEITRLAVTYGLVAAGMTMVMKSGGIDLSAGSTMAMAAVATGVLWNNAGLNIWVAAGGGLVISAACGWINGYVITRLKIVPLIATLGTMSLYRGIADAVTRGYTTYTGFDTSFLSLGQGYLGGVVPAQLPLFIAVMIPLWFIMHRMRFGRHVEAAGYGEEGARYAGIDTRRVLLRVYVIAGTLSGLAALIFIAKNGQAKSDAGTGYELMAIAMAVLGGTATTGGRGTLHGTMLGLLVIVVLQNGLRLCGQSTDIANILIGLILLGAILLDRISRPGVLPASTSSTKEKPEMTNRQLALLCATILASALIIALSMRPPAASGPVTGAPGAVSAMPDRIVVGMLPKTKTDPYFVSCKEGADAAAAETGVELLWDGPVKSDPEKQNEIVEAWITRGVDVICASVLNRDAIDGVLKKARSKGIRVLTWDADANVDARDFFINQATSEGIGFALADELATLCGESGSYAIVSAGTTDANQNEWIVHIKARMTESHPGMELKEIRYSEGERDKAMTETRNLLNKYPDLKGIMAIAAAAVPGAAEGLKQAGRTDIRLTGLSVPSLCRDYVHTDFIDSIILWNTVDLGYLTVHAARSLQSGALHAGTSGMDFGRLKSIEVGDGNVYLGKPMFFRKDNIDLFNF